MRIPEFSHFAHTSLPPRSLCLRSNCARQMTDGSKIGNSPSISCETQSTCLRRIFVRRRGSGNNAQYCIVLAPISWRMMKDQVKSKIAPTSAQAPGEKVVIGVSS
jgi:hypothetical protein